MILQHHLRGSVKSGVYIIAFITRHRVQIAAYLCGRFVFKTEPTQLRLVFVKLHMDAVARGINLDGGGIVTVSVFFMFSPLYPTWFAQTKPAGGIPITPIFAPTAWYASHSHDSLAMPQP